MPQLPEEESSFLTESLLFCPIAEIFLLKSPLSDFLLIEPDLEEGLFK